MWHRLAHALACTCCACRVASAGHRPHARRAGRHGLRTPSRTAQPLWCTGRCASRCAARQRPPPASDRRAGPPAVLPVQHGREQVVVAAFATALGSKGVDRLRVIRRDDKLGWCPKVSSCGTVECVERFCRPPLQRRMTPPYRASVHVLSQHEAPNADASTSHARPSVRHARDCKRAGRRLVDRGLGSGLGEKVRARSCFTTLVIIICR